MDAVPAGAPIRRSPRSHHGPLPRHQDQQAEPETRVEHGNEPHRPAPTRNRRDARQRRQAGTSTTSARFAHRPLISSRYAASRASVAGCPPIRREERHLADDDPDRRKDHGDPHDPDGRSATRPPPSAPTGTGTSCSRSCASRRPACRSSPASSSRCRSSSGSAELDPPLRVVFLVALGSPSSRRSSSSPRSPRTGSCFGAAPNPSSCRRPTGRPKPVSRPWR